MMLEIKDEIAGEHPLSEQSDMLVFAHWFCAYILTHRGIMHNYNVMERFLRFILITIEGGQQDLTGWMRSTSNDAMLKKHAPHDLYWKVYHYVHA